MTLGNSAKQDSCQGGGGKGSPSLRGWTWSLQRRRRALGLSLFVCLCASWVLLTACKVPQEETGATGPSAKERLGIEIDDEGIEIRELRRTKARLQREIRARRADVRKYEKARSEATLASRQAKAALDKSLSDLHFLEDSRNKATQRAKELHAWLDQLAKDEKEVTKLRARKKELPQLLEKARAAVAEEEAELASLNLLLQKLEADRPAAPAKPKK